MEKLLSLLAKKPVDNELVQAILTEIQIDRRNIRELINILLARFAGSDWSYNQKRIVVESFQQLLEQNGLEVQPDGSTKSGNLSLDMFEGGEAWFTVGMQVKGQLIQLMSSEKFPRLKAVDPSQKPKKK